MKDEATFLADLEKADMGKTEEPSEVAPDEPEDEESDDEPDDLSEILALAQEEKPKTPVFSAVSELRDANALLKEEIAVLRDELALVRGRSNDLLQDVASIRAKMFDRSAEGLERRINRLHELVYNHLQQHPQRGGN